MNYFQKLVIENFQSHQHTVIDFSKGLNVFVGPSDSGKSAILRALRWLLFNTPRGTDFIRSGTKECRVTLIFQDGTEVIRARGTSINRYILRTAEGEEHIFEGFGNEIPQEITDIHRIQTLKLDGKEMVIHLGTQLESPFLLFETAGNKAKTIGRVSGAHLIDKAFKKTSNDRQNANIEMKRLEQEMEELTERLKPYSNLREVEQQLDQAETAFLNAREAAIRVERLKRIKTELSFVRYEKEVHQQWLKCKESIFLMESLLKETERKTFLLSQITRLHRRWETVQGELKNSRQKVMSGKILSKAEEKIQMLTQKETQLYRLRKVKEKWDDVIKEKTHLQKSLARANELPNIEQTIMGLGEKVEKVKAIITILQKSEDVKWRITRGRQFKSEKEKEIASLIQKLAKVLKDLKQCPTCGSELHLSVMEHIIQEYQGGNSYVAAGREHSND